ncbi:MAG: alanine racemase, partial [bacterium]|nr:alanine racemase [bacterium]
MDKLLKLLGQKDFTYEPLIQVLISRNRLIHNLHEFKRIAPEGSVAPVLKSNAYGHGLIEVATIIEKEYWNQKVLRHRANPEQKNYVPFLIVDSYFEALQLRTAKIRIPILVIGYTRPEVIAHSRLKDVSFTITNLETLKNVVNFQVSNRPVTIHIKIDTGMHRQGLLPEELDQVPHLLGINPSIIFQGICSHFSDADNPDPSFTESQINLWNKIVPRMQTEYASIKYIHISNT